MSTHESIARRLFCLTLAAAGLVCGLAPRGYSSPRPPAARTWSRAGSLDTSRAVYTPALRANGKIAFTSDRDGNTEIYVMDADGSNQVRLTSNSVVDDHATWSPDGTKLAFLSQRASGEFAIFQMNGDGTGRTEITPVNYQPPRNLGWDYWSMSWSPDGRQITFQDGGGIYVVNADGSGRRFLTGGIQPAWSPDGSKILFSNQPVFFYWWLFTIRPDGTELQALPGAEPYVDTAATWSPGGDRIVFQGWDWANWEDLVVANADGTNRQTFAYGCYDNPGGLCGGLNFPAWSPDGSKIVFCLDGYGSDVDPEIWVKNVTGDGLTQLTNTAGNNVNPSWQPLAPAACPNPIDCTDPFVRQHYRDFLGREPDAPGLAFWTNEIERCGTDAGCREAMRVSVSAAFFLSIEFQRTGYQVIRIYKASFTDSPSRPRGLPRMDEFLRDTREAGGGVVVGTDGWESRLAASMQAFARNWVGTAEFVARFPEGLSAGEYVDRLFANAGAAPTGAERDAAVAAFGAGGAEGRAQALLSVTGSASVFNRQYNEAFVLMQYIGYLRRNPNDTPDAGYEGFDYWRGKLDSFTRDGEDARDEAVAIARVRRAEMVNSFLSSAEYRRRFSQP